MKFLYILAKMLISTECWSTEDFSLCATQRYLPPSVS